MINKHGFIKFCYHESVLKLGFEGRVNIMFIFQKDGNIGNIRLARPDKCLEADAKRIILKLPKKAPGKQ